MINRYDEIPKDKVNSIGLYCDNESKPYKTLTGKDINKFIKLLDDGVYSPNYSPNMNNGDPLYYLMLLRSTSRTIRFRVTSNAFLPSQQ